MATNLSQEKLNGIITKDWNGYQFKIMEKSDYPAVLFHLQQNFYRDEPMHKILGVTPEREADMDQKIEDILNLDHGSFFAFPEGKPDEIAAVLIIWYQEKDFELPQFEARSPLTLLVRKTIVQLKKQYSIHEQYGLDVYPELFIISTDGKHRGKGLATEMYRRAIEKMKSQGHKLVSSTFTNPFSRKIGDKLGFKPVSRMEMDDVRNEDGSKLFGEAGNGQFIVETVLEIIN